MVLELLPLALGSAAYPALLAIVVILLGRPNPRRLLLGYLCGALVTSVTSGMVIVSALQAGHVVGGSDHTFGPVINFVGAALALVVLWVILTDRDRRLQERRRRKKEAREQEGRDPWSRRVLSRDSVWLTFLVGMALSLPGALYLVALKDVAAADLPAAEALAYVLGFCLITFQWAIVPLAGYTIAPERTQRTIDSFNAWLVAHVREIATVLCGAAALYLLAKGLERAI